MDVNKVETICFDEDMTPNKDKDVVERKMPFL